MAACCIYQWAMPASLLRLGPFRGLRISILHGITRRRLIKIAGEQGLKVKERARTLYEAKLAKEALMTSMTSFVMPIIKIDDTIPGNGRPGSQTMILQELYLTYMEGNDRHSDYGKCWFKFRAFWND